MFSWDASFFEPLSTIVDPPGTALGTFTMPRVREIGRIVRLQVQRQSLKIPAPSAALHGRLYAPAPLIEVASLRVSPSGVVGRSDYQTDLVDVHHAQHASSKNVNGANAISIGFTAHYGLMRDRFGSHLTDGIAGENVLVDSAERVDLQMLGAEPALIIETRDGQRVRLQDVIVAEPCVEFTRFALGFGPADASGQAVTDGLRFLRFGMRGFYARPAGPEAVVRAGDRVLRPG